MARLPRNLLVEEGSTNHCTWRSHGHALVLDTDGARLVFLALLRKYKQKYGITIHSYCLMGTHPHVMCRASKGQRAFSDFWKVVNWGFARWYNRRTKGRGQVVMEELRVRRSDLVHGPFVGDREWVTARLVTCGVSPPA